MGVIDERTVTRGARAWSGAEAPALGEPCADPARVPHLDQPLCPDRPSSPGLTRTADLGRRPLGADDVVDVVRELAAADLPEDESACLEAVRVLEELKASASAAQATLTARLHALRSAAEGERGIARRDRCRGLGAEVALARRESPHRGGRHVGMARALVHEMLLTLTALTRGLISEEHATVMARESIWLEPEQRRRVDELMADRLGETGIRRLGGEARAHALRLDQAGAVERRERSPAQRRVSVRPAPAAAGAGMAHLSALLPLEQAVAAFAGLTRDAATIVGTGDHPHAHSTGRSSATPAVPVPVPVPVTRRGSPVTAPSRAASPGITARAATAPITRGSPPTAPTPPTAAQESPQGAAPGGSHLALRPLTGSAASRGHPVSRGRPAPHRRAHPAPADRTEWPA